MKIWIVKEYRFFTDEFKSFPSQMSLTKLHPLLIIFRYANGNNALFALNLKLSVVDLKKILSKALNLI